MTAEANFEKWWAAGVPVDEAHRIAKTGSPGKECARIAYLAATKATATRCVEICGDPTEACTCDRCELRREIIGKIKKEHGLE